MTRPKRQHVVLFPFMAQGHLIPFMAFARLLEQATNHTITLVNTPLNIQTLQSTLPPSSTIRLASIPFDGSDHGLPPNVENAHNLPCFNLFLKLLEASRSLKPSFHSFITSMDPLPICIISDMFFGWTVEIANQLGIFHSVFIASGAYGTAVYFSLWLNLPHSQTDSDEFSLPDFPEAIAVERSQLSNHLKAANGSDSWSWFLQQELSLCLRSDGILFNTVRDLEKTGLGYFRKKTNRPVWAIGPLKGEERGRKKGGISVDKCVSWLNLHRPSSVLFVSFGSQNTISASQMMELAMGLEESGKAFIWVIRPPLGNDVSGEFRAEWLPEGFEVRVAERKQGLLVRTWAPQLEILSHESTGAFLSHCGWNSILESLSQGVPLMGWPLAAEQFYNVKMLEEEAGVCVEIARGNSSEIEKGRVREVIEMVMGDTEKGEKMRRKALEIKETMEAAIHVEKELEGSSVKAMHEFIEKAIAATGRSSENNDNNV
ncbi:hypothetical protein AAC387_Pa06g1138 [Persea americana]